MQKENLRDFRATEIVDLQIMLGRRVYLEANGDNGYTMTIEGSTLWGWGSTPRLAKIDLGNRIWAGDFDYDKPQFKKDVSSEKEEASTSKNI